MTVKELIERLQTFNPNLEVLVDDLSGGTYDITDIINSSATTVQLQFNSDDEQE